MESRDGLFGSKLHPSGLPAWKRAPWVSARDMAERKGYAKPDCTMLEYLELREQRSCDLCGKTGGPPRRYHVDHCHETGRIRGVLCAGCNTGLGKLGDNREGLLRALDYLEEP